MIGAANVNGKVANKNELNGVVTVPNKVIWDKERIAEIEAAADTQIKEAEANAAAQIEAAAAENEKKLADKDKEYQAQIEELKAAADEKVKSAIDDILQNEYQFAEFVKAEPVSETDSTLIAYYNYHNDKITFLSRQSMFMNNFSLVPYSAELDKKYRIFEINIDLPNCTQIENKAFYNNSQVYSVNLPKCRIISDSAFYGSRIKELNLPECWKIMDSAFRSSSSYGDMKSLNLPKCTNLGSETFANQGFTKISLPAIQVLDNTAFRECTNLVSALFTNENITKFGGSGYYYAPFYMGYYDGKSSLKHIIFPKITSVPKLSNVDGLVGQSAKDKALLTIYVPAAMVDEFKAATNWSAYNIAAIEDNKEELQGIFTELDEIEGWS